MRKAQQIISYRKKVLKSTVNLLAVFCAVLLLLHVPMSKAIRCSEKIDQVLSDGHHLNQIHEDNLLALIYIYAAYSEFVHFFSLFNKFNNNLLHLCRLRKCLTTRKCSLHSGKLPKRNQLN